MKIADLKLGYDVEVIKFNSSEGYPADQNLYYECKKCLDIIPSFPEKSIGCTCRNIFIDVDGARVSIKDDSKMKLLMAKSKSHKMS